MRKNLLWILGAALGGILAAKLVLRRMENPAEDLLRTWRNLWKRELSTEDAAVRAELVRRHHALLYARRTRVQHPSARRLLEARILPAAALYLSLLDEGMEPTAAVAEVQRELEAWFAPQVQIVQAGGKTPLAYPMLRLFLPSMVRMNDGGKAQPTEWLELSSGQIAFNVRECFYLNTLTKLGMPELVPVFCALDDQLLQNYSPQVAWARTQTLAQGGRVCDFRFRRVAGR